MAEKAGMIPPGGCIGIVGGGQLGRMIALAAARLGYRSHIYAPETDSPAAKVSEEWTVADYEDHAALARFAASVDVITCEFENVPAGGLHAVKGTPVRPSPHILEIAQDRRREKSFINGLGIATAPWRPVESEAELIKALAEIGVPAVLKTAQLGYDGKGQVMIRNASEAGRAWAEIGGVPAVLEGFVRFEREVSSLVARGVHGDMAVFDVVENLHQNHILSVTRAPAPISEELEDEAFTIATRAAEALDLVGLLAVEMFVTVDGKLLVNELAPRPHNSGHWTIDACATSQFEQVVRAICGLPLGSPERFADAEMTNLIGDEVNAWPNLLAEPGVRLHLYGKAETRPGRKMGHVTRLRGKTG